MNKENTITVLDNKTTLEAQKKLALSNTRA